MNFPTFSMAVVKASFDPNNEEKHSLVQYEKASPLPQMNKNVLNEGIKLGRKEREDEATR